MTADRTPADELAEALRVEMGRRHGGEVEMEVVLVDEAHNLMADNMLLANESVAWLERRQAES